MQAVRLAKSDVTHKPNCQGISRVSTLASFTCWVVIRANSEAFAANGTLLTASKNFKDAIMRAGGNLSAVFLEQPLCGPTSHLIL